VLGGQPNGEGVVGLSEVGGLDVDVRHALFESTKKGVVFRVSTLAEHFRISQKSFLLAGPVNSIDT
jgi:hypothetical protein